VSSSCASLGLGRALQGSMRSIILAVVSAVFPALASASEQARHPTSGVPVNSGKLLPIKGARSANSCAAYGAGFVKVEGSNTCIRIGGAISIGAGASSGSR